MHLTKTIRRGADGRKYVYWVLRAAYWDKREKRQKQFYLAYIGPKRTIPESRARELARRISEKLGRKVTVEDLRKVKRLRIVPDRPG